MNELKITSGSLKEITSNISGKITHNHIGNITVINSYDLFFSFSNYREKKLLISLNPAHPFISLIRINNPCGTRIGMLSDTLRKEAKDGFITSFEMVNNDRIVALKYNHTNDFFEKEERTIVFELIPHRPNLILLDGNKRILYATHYTDITSDHKILKGLIYEELINNNVNKEETFDYQKYVEAAEKYYSLSLQRRLEEQYKPVITHIKSRIKTLKQKINVLNEEIKIANDNFKYQEIGTMILTYANDDEELKRYLKDNDVDNYDFSLNPGINANKMFQRYKKAKRTIEMDEIELKKTNDDIRELELSLSQIKFMNEDDIQELATLLFPHKFKIGNKKKIVSKPGEISYKGSKIFYGKNAKQNDFLTFKKANKSDLFFHVKDAHGSHVIVSSDNPDKEIILTACEIALILSGKETGDVQSTQVKNIKKGSYLGQAILTSYQTYTIKEIREETKKLF